MLAGPYVTKTLGEHGADMFALVVWSSLVPPLPLAALSYAFEGGTAAWQAVATASALTTSTRSPIRNGSSGLNPPTIRS